ncbi:MAG: hemolysin family protein [Spirochaetales bacterium]|jgi:CBS domain containing-hemolysin-like protein|nr:hemolysin family protein [Spirochaetales bacterium]
MLWYGILLVILIILSGFFSGVETAFTSLSFLQIQAIKKQYPKKGVRIEKAREHSENIITTILIANNLVNIGASVIVTALTLKTFSNAGLGISTGAITLIILIFGEVTPKRLAISHNAAMCVFGVDIIIGLSLILRPVVYFIGAISLLLTRIFGSAPGQKITLEGVFHLVNLAQDSGVLEDDTTQMMKSIMHFDEVKVQAIMTHRTQIFSLPADLTAGKAVDRVLEEGYSRIPVYEDNPENIVGVALAKDIWKACYEGRKKLLLKSLMIQPVFVSPQMSVYKLLSTLKEKKINLVVVLDEYGGLAGIVTYEDLIEEIIGEVYDEDEEKATEKITPQADGSCKILGNTPLYLINDSLDTSFPIKKSSQTLGGFLLDLEGNIPLAGERIATDEGVFIVEKIVRGRIILAHYFPEKQREV